MARIVYGVAGEGFGHSSRSHLIGQHLLDAGHEVLFVASNKSLSYLRRYFGARVKETFGLRQALENGRLSPVKTVVTNVRRFLTGREVNLRLYREVLDPFQPDLVITDFEPFSAWWAWRNRVPFVSIDHEHVLTLGKLEHQTRDLISRWNAEVVTRCHYVGAAAYLILNFFRVPVRNGRSVLAPPVVRPQVHSFTPTCGDHIVVYTMDVTWKDRLLATLHACADSRFRIYGFDEDQRLGNCELRRTSTEGFLSDLASCRGIIATAGFSLISECLHFRKRMLLLPVPGQYEQTLNACQAERLGLALHRERLDGATLAEYLGFLQEPARWHEDVLWPDNDRFLRLLHTTLAETCPALAGAPARIPMTARLLTDEV